MAPVLTSLTPNFGPEAGFNSVVIAGSGFSGVGPLTVHFDTAATTFTIDSDTQITAIAPGGAGTVQVTVTALLDGTSNAVPYTYAVASAPVLTSLDPDFGATIGGTVVTLTGTGFSGATAVSFGTTAAASFTVDSDTQITAITSAASEGPVDVTVTTATGTSNPVTFIYIAFPTITAITPIVIPETGGAVVTITGTGLSRAVGVLFDDIPATSFTVVSDTQVTAVSPPLPGSPYITIFKLTVSFDFRPFRIESEFVLLGFEIWKTKSSLLLLTDSPKSGPTFGGNPVVLTGIGLSSATGVFFGATAAAGFTVDSDNQITAVVPAAAPGPVLVTVQTPAGTTEPVIYTYVAAPTLSTVAPDSGPTTGGTTVALTGTGFSTAGDVLFDSTPAPSFTIDSDTQITAAVTPPNLAGVVNVTVTNPGGISNAISFTYIP